MREPGLRSLVTGVTTTPLRCSRPTTASIAGKCRQCLVFRYLGDGGGGGGGGGNGLMNVQSFSNLATSRPLLSARTTMFLGNVQSRQTKPVTVKRYASVVAQNTASIPSSNNGNGPDAATGRPTGPSKSNVTRESIEEQAQEITQEYRRIVTSPRGPDESAILHFVKRCQGVVELVMEYTSENTDTRAIEISTPARPPASRTTIPGIRSADRTTNANGNATTSLLDLDSESRRPPPLKANASVSERTVFKQKISSTISDILNNLLRDSKVFISPDILRLYVNIQCRINSPERFPETFHLYASKPLPVTSANASNKSRIPNPNNPRNAVPADIANKAIDVAISNRNLPLALAIIDTTFCKPAFRRSKYIQKAALPLFLLTTATPAAAWLGGKSIASMAVAMDPRVATWVGFTGIMAYVGFTAIVGGVAITTANDQMERVVWVPGMQLRERWVREEERAALDRISLAWGFKDKVRWGEEEGEEWENLREIIGMRGMILDKSDMLEGME